MLFSLCQLPTGSNPGGTHILNRHTGNKLECTECHKISMDYMLGVSILAGDMQYLFPTEKV